ncbi:MAG TPA: NADP-dependent phosphogluconate dehydrogenase [Candidatus Saccharimonadales bacterium]
MRIAVHGLGRMGGQIAQKLSEASDQGITLIAHNRSPEPIELAVSHGAVAAYTKQEVIDKFDPDETVIIWLMLPSDVTDQHLQEWLEIVPSGSILIDGGNSDYRLSIKRSELVSQKGCSFIDVGVSGGIWGYQNGFAMMAGSDSKQSFNEIEAALKVLAAPEGDYAYFGETGSGHFVKMTHNAIEYGMMESLSEGYRLLKEGPYQGIDLESAARVWQHHSVVTSWLNELVLEIMHENPELDGIEGKVAQTGEAAWALETAKDLGIDMPAINDSFQVRIDSENGAINYSTKLLAAIRNKFGGHKLNN